MAIQPRYARAILAGTKRVEFRKRALAPDVHTVLIYETAPTQRVVGRFTVGECVAAAPAELWRRFRRVGGIPEDDFAGYYGNRPVGVGLTVCEAERYARPVALAELTPAPAVPQSFAYLDADVLEQIRSRQPRNGILDLRNAAAHFTSAPGRLLVGAGRIL